MQLRLTAILELRASAEKAFLKPCHAERSDAESKDPANPQKRSK